MLLQDSGCDAAPAGTTIIVDPSIQPENQDFVFAKVNEQASVFRFIALSGRKFLGVDDQRIPFIEVGSSAEIIGVVVFITRKLK
ncbi:hypothetical protein ABK905_09235 [Acerihabitans sp. KWT182]|uniref:Peptidase S24/S26A/S26B/S26C domain-containing protein n=1 Tax=Acerihabitans sp. KWT182 TaxID=3157919 RepID=A0AAU7QFV6_9GAMM